MAASSFLRRSLLASALSFVLLGLLVGWAVVSGHLFSDTDFAALHPIPAERRFLVARESSWSPPEARLSPTPVVELRRGTGGGYELLYWGNPVRAAYAYRIVEAGSGQTVLRTPEGIPQGSRPLPMTAEKRADGRLPLQGVLPLTGLAGTPGRLYAVRVEILDAQTGIVLCRSEYLVEGNQPNSL